MTWQQWIGAAMIGLPVILFLGTCVTLLIMTYVGNHIFRSEANTRLKELAMVLGLLLYVCVAVALWGE